MLEDAIAEWAAKEKPANQRTAELLAMTANCHRKKGQRPFKAADFLPKQKREETHEEEYNRLMLQFSRLT